MHFFSVLLRHDDIAYDQVDALEFPEFPDRILAIDSLDDLILTVS
jgi:hypothetical protein